MSTTGIVLARILRSRRGRPIIDVFEVELDPAIEVDLVAPLICQRQVSPGRIESRRRCQRSYRPPPPGSEAVGRPGSYPREHVPELGQFIEADLRSRRPSA